LEQRERFGKAVVFAKTMLLDPAIKADYEVRARQAGLNSAYSAAIADYLRDPQLASIQTDFYKGVVGDTIWVVALDDFKIQRMSVTIHSAQGAEVESGEAVAEGGRWKYVTKQPNANWVGSKVVASATNRPGRVVQLEKVLA